MATGIFSLEDLVEQRYVPASQFGLDKIADAIQARLDWLNGQVNEQMSLFAETSEDSRRIWGGSETYAMKEVDEFGVARTQKDASGVEVHFPLRKFSVSTGWTADYMRRATVADLAKSAIGIQNAYLERIQSELKFGIFNDDSYSFIDKFGDGTTLSVKAFLNADSIAIPNAPDGTSFTASTHSHYAGYASGALAYGDVDTLISNVVEHGLTKGVALFIPAGMVATLVALSGTKFVKLTSALLVPANDSVATVARINPEADLNNVLVGYWDGRVPVYTRSWMPANYMVCVATGAAEKPLIHRVDKFIKGLAPMVEVNMHPLTAKTYEAFVGFGAFNRAAVAILDTANSSYTEPTLIR